MPFLVLAGVQAGPETGMGSRASRDDQAWPSQERNEERVQSPVVATVM